MYVQAEHENWQRVKHWNVSTTLKVSIWGILFFIRFAALPSLNGAKLA
jgi:hypothetical protein